MVVVNKAYKKLAYALIVVVICLLGANIAVNVWPKGVNVSGGIESFDPDTIVIDAGHGGPDGGASNAGISEENINLSIALMLSDMYKASGYNVILTRDSDSSTVEMPNGKFSKKDDIKKRLELIEKSHNSMAISIHQNQYPSSKIWGAQVFYGTKNPLSKDIAQKLQRNVHILSKENKRVAKPITSDVYLVHKATVPTVLVECGFLSNDIEREKLMDKEYQKLVAFWIYSSTISNGDVRAS